jgi:mannitol-1-/sugar-/sorbitol-6-phosphatase
MYFRGLLFDLDGTLVNSLDFVEASWSDWANRKGFNALEVRNFLHGKPAISTLRHFMPQASEVAIRQEFLVLEDYEARNTEGITPVAGAAEFLTRLNALHVPWGIVTSGSLRVASARIHQAGFPFPGVLVTSEDIQHGKPHPEPFLLGAQKLNVSPSGCIAFEDSEAGLRAASEAGTVVVEVLTPQASVHNIETYASISHYLDLTVTPQRGADFSLRVNH